MPDQNIFAIKDVSALSRAEEIAGIGKYEDIINELRENGLFSSFVEAVQSAYEERLSLGRLFVSERDFEMLAVLGLYDAKTLEHSVRTFELAYRIITHPFILPSGETIVFGDLLFGAGVSRDQFLRAALFHDIGKVIIPREILRNALDDEEVLVKMFPEENFEAEDGERTKKAVLQTFYRNGFRPIDIAPLKEIFSGEEHAEFLRDLQRRGFKEGATLKDVIRMHEPESKHILTAAGYPTEGELAGCHHNYEKEPHVHTISTPYGTFGVADLIRIADMTDALRSARWYKRPLSELEVLFILANDVRQGKIDSLISFVWISDQYKELRNRQPQGEGAVLSEDQRQEEARFIESFLEEEQTRLQSARRKSVQS